MKRSQVKSGLRLYESSMSFNLSPSEEGGPTIHDVTNQKLSCSEPIVTPHVKYFLLFSYILAKKLHKRDDNNFDSAF